MWLIRLFKMPVTINELTYHINPQQLNCQQHHHCQKL